MTYRETVVRGKISTRHLVQLFDNADSLAVSVSEYVREGVLVGETVLALITSEHWSAVETRLRAGGLAVDAAVSSNQLTVRDAADALQQCMRQGLPDRARFEAVLAAPIRRLAARGRPLRVYGEIVDLLADQGDSTSAQQLEDLWNALGESASFELLCGYSAVHFGDPQNADALRGICHSHFQVRSSPPDVLASFLVDTYRAEPPVA